MAIRAARLHWLDGVVALGDGIRTIGFLFFIDCIDLLSQDRAIERSGCLASFVSRKVRGQHGIVEQHRLRLDSAELAFAVVLGFEITRDTSAFEVSTGVKPRLSERGG